MFKLCTHRPAPPPSPLSLSESKNLKKFLVDGGGTEKARHHNVNGQLEILHHVSPRNLCVCSQDKVKLQKNRRKKMHRVNCQLIFLLRTHSQLFVHECWEYVRERVFISRGIEWKIAITWWPSPIVGKGEEVVSGGVGLCVLWYTQLRHSCVRACAHPHTRTQVFRRLKYACTHVCIHTYKSMHAHIHRQTYRQTGTYRHRQAACTRINTQTLTHTRTHARTHAHTHAHTHTLAPSLTH